VKGKVKEVSGRGRGREIHTDDDVSSAKELKTAGGSSKTHRTSASDIHSITHSNI